MELRFVTSESTPCYFTALESYLLKHGRPVAFYSDKQTTFRVAKSNEHMTGMTQFGCALAELNIEPDRLSEVFYLRSSHACKHALPVIGITSYHQRSDAKVRPQAHQAGDQCTDLWPRWQIR